MAKISLRVLALGTCLGALVLVFGVAGCAGDRYHRGPGYPSDNHGATQGGESQKAAQLIEDSRTAERVREALAAGIYYKFDAVKVTACAGVIQLNGSVNTNAQRTSAAEVTHKVVGVKSVDNRLTVKN